jgi:cysteinyl-tRNA synthetase
MIRAFHILLLGSALNFSGAATSRTRTLSDVHDFVYQLQNIDLAAIGETGFDLVVIDYSSDGSDAGAFSGARIEALKHGAGGEKTVLSYLSIGEAEDYRFYWQSGWKPGNPSWLDSENPEWKGNYKIRYWEPGWQAVILQYLDKILDSKFDGVYCDVIDAYEYYQERGRSEAAAEMADFVAAVRSYARARDPDFFVFVQNAAELAGIIPSYLDAMDGIGQEDIYYSDGEAVPAEDSAAMEDHLKVFRDAGKLVLTIDYPFASGAIEPHFDAETRTKIDRAYGLSLANGFIPYCTVRNLGFLTVNPGHEPSAAPEERRSAAPARFMLMPNFPNPFNGETRIPYSLREDGFVSLKVSDLLGREIANLEEGLCAAGSHAVVWNGNALNGIQAPSGIYVTRFYWSKSGKSITHHVKMTLVR